MVDQNFSINAPTGMSPEVCPADLRQTPYGFSNKKVDNEIANLLSGGGRSGELDTHNEWVKVNDYLEENKNNLTIQDRSIIQSMLQKFQAFEQQFEMELSGYGVSTYGGESIQVPEDRTETPVSPKENPVQDKPNVITESKPEAEAPKSLTPEEMKAARDVGESVANKLLGHTNNSEQSEIQAILADKVDSNNVMQFLRGYETQLTRSNGLTTKDHFFEQMRTEYNFPEQQDLMRKVAGDLQGYLANKYGADSDIAKEVAVILLEGTLGEEEAKALDEIVLAEIGDRKNNTNPLSRFIGMGGIIKGVLNNE